MTAPRILAEVVAIALGTTWQQAEDGTTATGLFPVIAGEPMTDPAPDYAVLWPSTGVTSTTSLADDPNRLTWQVRIMAVSRSLTGCLEVAQWVRACLDRLRMPGGGRLRDDSYDGLTPLVDGPPNDRRYSLTLDFRTITTTRSTT